MPYRQLSPLWRLAMFFGIMLKGIQNQELPVISDTRISDTEIIQLTHNAQILEADEHGAKVYRLSDGRFLKVFRRKRLLSSALLRPYSRRFIDNAASLMHRHISTVEPLAHFRLEKPGRTAVLYSPLEGETLRAICTAEDFNWDRLLPKLITFVCNLHTHGIYFRSLHLGNIVLCNDGTLGLIDIADMTFRTRALPKRLRKRNLAHFTTYLAREGLIKTFPLRLFLQEIAK